MLRKRREEGKVEMQAMRPTGVAHSLNLGSQDWLGPSQGSSSLWVVAWVGGFTGGGRMESSGRLPPPRPADVSPGQKVPQQRPQPLPSGSKPSWDIDFDNYGLPNKPFNFQKTYQNSHFLFTHHLEKPIQPRHRWEYNLGHFETDLTSRL